MKFTLSIMLIILVMFSVKVEAQENSIPINEIHNKTHVTVKIGNVIVPDILIDSGFPVDGLMIYNPDYKDSIDLSSAKEVRIPGAGSGKPAKGAILDSAEFYLEDIKMINQRIIVLKDDIFKGFPSNGIIGYSIFGHYTCEFNYDNNTLILHDAKNFHVDKSWTEIPLYFKDNKIPWIDISVVITNEEPISISTYIDYAAGEPILLLEKNEMKFSLPEQTENVYLGRGLSGDIYGKSAKISKLIFGPYELKNVTAAIALAQVRSKQKNADAILGVRALRRFNLIFDYGNKKLYIKPNRHFNDPF